MTASSPLRSVRKSEMVRFSSIAAADVEPTIDLLLTEAERALEALEAADHAAPTYASTMDALEAVTDELHPTMAIVTHLESVATTPALREAYAAVQPKVSAFLSKLELSRGVFRAVRGYAASEEAARLPVTERRFVTRTLEDLRRSGAELDHDGKSRLAAIHVELTNLAVKYAQNVLDAAARFELVVDDRARLAGMPEEAIEAARASAVSRGLPGYRLTLQAPSYFPAMTRLHDASIREALYRAYHTKASGGDLDNRGVVARMLALRKEKAKLLGFRTFADLILDDRMAKDGARARAFVDDLWKKLAPHVARENDELFAFRRREGDLAPMQAWDLLYWSERQARALYGVDEEQIKPYFPEGAVLAGVFEIARRLYGVTVEPWDAETWHPSVRAYRFRDRDGKHLASFYVDLFPRESKQDGAWMHGLVNGAKGEPHLAVICANVTPPAGSAPALLRLREVETVFHEFGHLLHHCLSDVSVRALAGTNVATDFVELPSKLHENWVWEREALDLFAKHYASGARLPDELFAQMRRARTYRAANALARQLGFAALDLALHVDYDPVGDGDVVAYARRVFEAYSPVALPDDYAMVTSFSHLFSDPVGYAAGYYSYCWADVLDADAFQRFKRGGIFDPAIGEAFRASILARGNSADPMELYKEFTGHEPEASALLVRLGVAA